MARASTIWLVTDAYTHTLAAFTVKHECVQFLASKPEINTRYLLVQRVPDGRAFNHHDSPYVKAQEFLERNR